MADPNPPRRRADGQLPAGRHNLGREFVVVNQRTRILEAVADVNSLAGYASMSVEDIIRTAGVSRRSFYDLFDDKEQVFLMALDIAVAELMNTIRRAARDHTEFASGTRACVEAALDFVVGDPRQAEMLLIDAPAGGSAAIARRSRTVRALAAVLRTQAERLLEGPLPPKLTAEAIVGGIFEVAYARVLSGKLDELRSLAPDITYALLQPYLGQARARQEAGLAPVPSPPQGTSS